MANFEANIKAVLDLAKAQSDLNSFVNQTRSVKLNVDLQTGNVNISNLVNQLQQQFSQAGKQAGQTFTQSVNNGIGKLNVSHTAAEISNLQKSLQNMNFNQSAIDTITKNLTSMDIAINKVTTDISSKTGNLRIKVDGIDQSVSGMERMVTITKEFDSASGVMVNSGEKIAQTFGNIDKVVSKANEWQSKLEAFKARFKDVLDISGGNNKLADKLKGIDFSGINNQAALDAMVGRFKEAIEYGDKLNSMLNKTWATNAIEKMNERLARMPNELKIIEERFKSLGGNHLKNVSADIEALRQGFQDIGKVTDVEERIKKFNELDNLLKRIKLDYQQSAASQKDLNLEQDKQIVSNKLEAWMNKNTVAAHLYKQELADIQARLKSVNSSGDLKQLQKDITNIQTRAAAEGNLGKGFFGTLIGNFTKISPLLGIGSAMTTANRLIRSSINSVKELDYALVDLQKTTTMSQTELNDFYYKSNDVAKEMGVTTKEIIEQASAWSRLGFSGQKEATEMAKLSSQFKSISPGMTMDQATDGLVSVMKAKYMPCCTAMCN